MRILYFTRDYTSHDYRFLDALAKTEHEVYYLRMERGEHPLEDRSLPPEVECINWEGGRAPAKLLDGPRLLFDLKRVIRETKPDLIHAGPLQRSAFLAALTGFHPLVSMSWGYDLLQDANRNAMWRWATRYTLKHSAAMVGDCNTIRQLAISYGMSNERIVTFPWGIDLDHFTPIEKEKKVSFENGQQSGNSRDQKPPFTLLSTRSWEPLYGVEIIARAFVQATIERPELRLVMLGTGSQATSLRQILSQDGNSPRLARTSQPQGLNSKTFYPGQIKYSELPRIYRSADLYISASRSDGTSISLLEAMACACPVLVSDIPGNREWVTPGENGWLFPDGDSTALAKAILLAFEQRHQLLEMGRRGRQLVEKRANWEQNFPKLLSAYEIAQK